MTGGLVTGLPSPRGPGGWFRRGAAVLIPCVTFGAGACSLTETSLADAADEVIVEVVLRAGDTQRQRAFLYRTLGTGLPSTASGAVIEISDANGPVMTLDEVPVRNCIDNDVMGPLDGSCYEQDPRSSGRIRAGTEYTLRITLRDGGVITGTTTVPSDFDIVSPASDICQLDPARTTEVRWTSAGGAWVYVSEATINGLADALAPLGVELEQDPLHLVGLSISRQDTTIVFPTGFGLFDRADPAVADALVEIRDGLPPGVRTGLVVGAADRNYVNWARGGNFNPSGLVRVPSVQGDGTGVFGSVVVRSRILTTVSESTAGGCD